jgi:hypothetical protein
LHTGFAMTTHESLWSNQLVATILEEDQTKSWDNNDANDFFRSDSYPQPLDPLGDPKESTSTIPTDIHGDIDMIERLISLCHRFVDIFSRDVRPTPADIPPFEIAFDMMKWHQSSNRAPPRPMTIAKQLELKKQLDKLVKLKVIERSEAPYYSQVLLVPKPFNKWRFCLDYRKLNDATEYTSAWSLPNIEQMINRIGDHSPEYFGIMDLTSGYHQAPLAQSSRIFTAFICFMGVFQWTRVAMGAKGAASYFQEQLATVVLAGMLYIICEVYLDDIIVYGRTKEEFIERLTQVFERLRKHNITLNPDKVTLGVHEIEYVGHLLNKKGHTFTRDKIDSVLNFVKPATVSSLQSFLGLTKYFASHIRDYSKVVHPLRKLITTMSTTSSKLITWTEESNKAYDDLLIAFDNIPVLYFLEPNKAIFLETDACEH